MKIIMDIDDICPKFDLYHMDSLHDALGLKFECFVPTEYHGKYNLLVYQRWFEELLRRDYVKINLHGHKHRAEDGSAREYLFTDKDNLINNISESLRIFNEFGVEPQGIKAPGWDTIPEYVGSVTTHFDFKFIALNERADWIKDGILPYTFNIHENISPKSDTVILHSHIHPSQGDNGLCESLVLKLINDLKDYELEPMFWEEARCKM